MASSPLVILSGQKSAIEVPEILAIIFHFLSNRDVQTSRLVCKAWSLTGNDAILARSKNLLQVVLVVSESITSATAGVKKSKHSFVDGELLKQALELASRKAGLDSQAYGIQAEINALIVCDSMELANN
ncbi:hypothetical protein HDU79_005805 [Rhizoclosmatium sp. JEL0117]|nr:hypothetical protein HDU79_005805 [Rhizoclosmatium sp. JEL0117]